MIALTDEDHDAKDNSRYLFGGYPLSNLGSGKINLWMTEFRSG